jgi:hypothetical protein
MRCPTASPLLALPLLSPLAAGAPRGDADWATLDAEVARLAASAGQDDPAVQLGGHVQAVLLVSDENNPGPGGDHLSGVDVPLARLHAERAAGEGTVGFRIEADFAVEPELLDAYVDVPVHGPIAARLGQFKAPVAASALRHRAQLFFLDYSHIGRLWAGRAEGAQLGGDYGELSWALALQDGADGAGDEVLVVGRLAYQLAGSPVAHEGAYGVEERAARVGLAYYDDGGTDDGSGTLLDAELRDHRFSLSAEVLAIGDGLYAGNGSPVDLLDGVAPQGLLAADTTPWAIAGTLVVEPGSWEVGLRYQDYDNDDDERRAEAALVHTMAGHDLKWTFQASTTDSDAFGDSTMLQVGLTAGF